MKTGFWLCALCLWCQTSIGQIIPKVQGWSNPISSIFKEKWRQKSKDRFLICKGDFNNDGIPDKAYILQPENGLGIGIFVELSDINSTKRIICIYDSTSDLNITKNKYKERIHKWYMANWGIRRIKKGKYKTAVGKGYYEPKANEPDFVEIVGDGIDFFPYDAEGNKYFYWDSKNRQFLSQQMSD